MSKVSGLTIPLDFVTLLIRYSPGTASLGTTPTFPSLVLVYVTREPIANWLMGDFSPAVPHTERIYSKSSIEESDEVEEHVNRESVTLFIEPNT